MVNLPRFLAKGSTLQRVIPTTMRWVKLGEVHFPAESSNNQIETMGTEGK